MLRLQPNKSHISAVFRKIQGKTPNNCLARRTGVHLNTVYNYRKDNPAEQLVTFIKLCEVLGYDVVLVKRSDQ